MKRIQYISCEGCNAALHIQEEESTLECIFCGTSNEVQLIEKLTKKQQYLDIEANEAAQFLAEVWELQSWSKRAFALPQSIKDGFLATFYVLGTLCGMFVFSFESGCGTSGFVPFFFLSFVLLAVIFTPWITYFKERAAEQKRIAYAEARKKLKDKYRHSNCPSCQAKISLPPWGVYFECIFCDTPLIASEGLLIERIENVQRRGMHWKTEAEKLWNQIETIKTERHIAYYDILFVLALVILFVGFVGLTLVYVIDGSRFLT